MVVSIKYADNSISYGNPSENLPEIVRLTEVPGFRAPMLTVMTFKNELYVAESIFERIRELLGQIEGLSSKRIALSWIKLQFSELLNELSLCFAVLRAMIDKIPGSYNKRIPPEMWAHIEEWEKKESGNFYTLLRKVDATVTETIHYPKDYDIELFAAKPW